MSRECLLRKLSSLSSSSGVYRKSGKCFHAALKHLVGEAAEDFGFEAQTMTISRRSLWPVSHLVATQQQLETELASCKKQLTEAEDICHIAKRQALGFTETLERVCSLYSARSEAQEAHIKELQDRVAELEASAS